MKRTTILVLGLTACSSATTTTTSTRVTCDPANAGLTLPTGFCAQVAADSVGRARHIAVAANGDVYVALDNRQQTRGGVLALRDADGDGRFEQQERFGENNGGSGIAVRDNALYFATNNAVLRYVLDGRQLRPIAGPDTIIRELPVGGHASKSLALGRGNELFVNIGSRSNSCQTADRQPNSPGADPCVELETRAGVWLFDANKKDQKQADGVRYATGLRNAFAITTNARGELYGLQHGRDGLQAPPIGQWTFSNEYGAETPAEIMFRAARGEDYGWPYCYYSVDLKKTVLAPEYGGNGTEVGRCAEKKAPLLAFPGHWAPNHLTFYTGTQFPAKYRNGVFIAFHGSWNRAPLPQAGYNVAFVPMSPNGTPSGAYEVFADGFRGAGQGAQHRPTGVAMARDGSLLVTDDQRGRIYRISVANR